MVRGRQRYLIYYGQISPTTGEVYFKGQDITKLSISDRTRLGIGRSFQLTNIFPELTVLENVRLSVQSFVQDYYSFSRVQQN